MKPKYVDYVDLEGSFEELVDACKVLGSSLETKNELAVEGFLGEGYFVRKDPFVRHGTEIHRIYTETHEHVDTLLGLKKKFVFKAGGRQVTVEASSFEDALFKARDTLDRRLAKKSMELPVAWTLELVKRRYELKRLPKLPQGAVSQEHTEPHHREEAA